MYDDDDSEGLSEYEALSAYLANINLVAQEQEGIKNELMRKLAKKTFWKRNERNFFLWARRFTFHLTSSFGRYEVECAIIYFFLEMCFLWHRDYGYGSFLSAISPQCFLDFKIPSGQLHSCLARALLQAGREQLLRAFYHVLDNVEEEDFIAFYNFVDCSNEKPRSHKKESGFKDVIHLTPSEWLEQGAEMFDLSGECLQTEDSLGEVVYTYEDLDHLVFAMVRETVKECLDICTYQSFFFRWSWKFVAPLTVAFDPLLVAKVLCLLYAEMYWFIAKANWAEGALLLAMDIVGIGSYKDAAVKGVCMIHDREVTLLRKNIALNIGDGMDNLWAALILSVSEENLDYETFCSFVEDKNTRDESLRYPPNMNSPFINFFVCQDTLSLRQNAFRNWLCSGARILSPSVWK